MSSISNEDLRARFETLTTAHVADGCVREGIPVRCAPTATRPVAPGMRLAGRALPARHSGSVDVFLEAFERADPGDVLVVDNGGLVDEACVGDLVALEAASAGVGGILIWGLNRDTDELVEIGLPVFSLGSLPIGPLAALPRHPQALESARVGEWMPDRTDLVFADADGALFVPADRAEAVLDHAEHIRDTERRQADLIRSGTSLRQQVRFTEFLAARELDPALTFRDHLRGVGGEIEV